MKLLILKPSSLGDIVHALIVAQAIKAQRSDARIAWVVRSTFAPILEATAIVDEVIPFDRKGGVRGFWKLLHRIRAERYDATLDMQALIRTGLMNLAARAPLKLCRRDQREGAQLFATKRVALPADGSRHAVDMLMEFLPPLGLEKRYAPLLLKPAAVPELPPGCVLVFPSSRGKWAQKEWPYARDLTARLRAAGRPVAWCSDVQVEGGVPAGALDFCQKVTLRELLPFIAQVGVAEGAGGVVIGNDAGPTHMAAALGVRTVGLYGPTLPERAGPYPLESPRNVALRAASGKMGDISVDDVFAAAEGLLNAERGTPNTER